MPNNVFGMRTKGIADPGFEVKKKFKKVRPGSTGIGTMKPGYASPSTVKTKNIGLQKLCK